MQLIGFYEVSMVFLWFVLIVVVVFILIRLLKTDRNPNLRKLELIEKLKNQYMEGILTKELFEKYTMELLKTFNHSKI